MLEINYIYKWTFFLYSMENKINEKEFLGSRCEGENEEEHLEREANWKEDHACSICGSFECDGCHEDTWYDYAEKAGILEAEGAE